MHAGRTKRPLRIAIAYSRLPFPMMRGDQLTISHLISYLAARGHQVDLYTLDVDGSMTADQESWLRASCRRVELFAQSKTTSVLNMITGLFRGWPFQVGYFFNRKLAETLQAATNAGEYDIVYCYYLRSAPAIRNCFTPNVPSTMSGRPTAAFLAMQLSQSLNTRRIFLNEPNKIKKLVYFLEWRLLRRYEARIWKRFSKTVLIGPYDVDAIKTACCEENVSEISNWIYGAHGTDVRRFRAAEQSEVVPGRVVFSGSMLYRPNIQAVLWFLEHCWAEIRLNVPFASLEIVGRDPVPKIVNLNGQQGITVTGTVPDVSSHIRAASVCINPMLAAGGMQNKLIEYMACKKPIVASSIANEGIRGKDGECLIIADDAESFIHEVTTLLTDTRKAISLGEQARAFVLANWTWEAHFKRLEQDFLDSLKQATT
jgi:glycosyltransferase involved in cell wall biosynthesis